MKATSGRKKAITTPARRKANERILPALVAVGGACGLTIAPVSALELGEITIDSTLGQPLRASIAYALQPNEQISEFCIFLNPGPAANGIPGVGNPLIALTDRAILLRGRSPVREPLLALRLNVKCPYSPILARDYTLMIDPALPTADGRVTLVADGAPLQVVQNSPATAAVVESSPGRTQAAPTQTRTQDESPIASSGRYLVRPGDSLSEIVSRIENRPIALWPAVDAIFAANPDAFLNNDRDLLKAGTWLVIPDMTDVGTAATAPDTVAAAPDTDAILPATTVDNVESFNAYAGVAVPQNESMTAQIEQPAPVAGFDPVTVEDAGTPVVRQGDAVVSTDNSFVVPVETAEVIDIPDTVVESPQIAQPVPVDTVSGTPGTDNKSSWLTWLGGAGLAVLLGMLLFGRQLRNRFGSAAINKPLVPSRRRDVESDSQTTVTDVDFDFDKAALNSQPARLDADLDAGTGLRDSGLSAVALSDESIPPDFTQSVRLKIDSILDSEILPTDYVSDENEDPSVKVDAETFVSEYNSATAVDLPALSDSPGDTGERPSGVAIDCQAPERGDDVESTATLMLTDELEEAVHEPDQGDNDVNHATAEIPAPQDAATTTEILAHLAASLDDDTSAADTTEMPVSHDPDVTGEFSVNLPAELFVENEYYDVSDVTIEMDSDRIIAKMSKAS